MWNAKLKIKEALSSLNVDQLKVRKQKYAYMVLVVSDDFAGERIMKRIERVVALLGKNLPKEDYGNNFFIVEPVTSHELSQRIFPWPK